VYALRMERVSNLMYVIAIRGTMDRTARSIHVWVSTPQTLVLFVVRMDTVHHQISVYVTLEPLPVITVKYQSVTV